MGISLILLFSVSAAIFLLPNQILKTKYQYTDISSNCTFTRCQTDLLGTKRQDCRKMISNILQDIHETDGHNFHSIEKVKDLFEYVYEDKKEGINKVEQFLLLIFKNVIDLNDTQEKCIGCFVSKLLPLHSQHKDTRHKLVAQLLELMKRIENEKKTLPHGHV